MVSDSAGARPKPPIWLWAAVLVVAVLAFWPSFRGGFLADDFTYISRFRAFPWTEWPRLFTADWSGGVWGWQLRELRPFAALSFIIDSRLHEGNATGYRLTNLLLHLASVVLVTALTWRYSRGNAFAAALAGLVFALHPAHVEPVTWITGRVDLIGTVSALAFIYFAERFSENGSRVVAVIALLALFVGLFSKEFCMFAPAILLCKWLILDFASGRAAWIRRGILLGGAALIFGIYAYCRTQAFGSENVGIHVWNDPNSWQRHVGHLGWLVPILPFSGIEEWRTIPSLATAQNTWIAACLVGLLALVAARWTRAHELSHVLFFGFVWYLFTVVPLMAVGYFTPRHLYFPTAGLAIAVGLLATFSRLKYFVFVAAIVPLAFSHRIVLRPWATAGTISRDVLSHAHAALASADASFVLITSVPERFETALLWAWSLPAGTTPPFLASGSSARILARPGNYVRPDHWLEEQQPAKTLKETNEGFALYVDDRGRVFSRRMNADDLRHAAETLDATIARGLSPDAYSEWVKQLATRKRSTALKR